MSPVSVALINQATPGRKAGFARLVYPARWDHTPALAVVSFETL